jgi:hypothetical protein
VADLHPGLRTSPVKPGYRPKVILLPSSLGMFVDGVTTPSAQGDGMSVR